MHPQDHPGAKLHITFSTVISRPSSTERLRYFTHRLASSKVPMVTNPKPRDSLVRGSVTTWHSTTWTTKFKNDPFHETIIIYKLEICWIRTRIFLPSLDDKILSLTKNSSFFQPPPKRNLVCHIGVQSDGYYSTEFVRIMVLSNPW